MRLYDYIDSVKKIKHYRKLGRSYLKELYTFAPEPYCYFALMIYREKDED